MAVTPSLDPGPIQAVNGGMARVSGRWTRIHVTETIASDSNSRPRDSDSELFKLSAQLWPGRRFAGAALLPRRFGNRSPGHTTRAPPVGFELATDGIQFYAFANSGLDNTVTITVVLCLPPA